MSIQILLSNYKKFKLPIEEQTLNDKKLKFIMKFIDAIQASM